MGDRLQEAVHLNRLSWVLSQCEGRMREGEETALRARELAREGGGVRQQGWALLHAGWALRGDPGNLERELDCTRRAADLLLRAEDLEGCPGARTSHIGALRRAGRIEEARQDNCAVTSSGRFPRTAAAIRLTTARAARSPSCRLLNWMSFCSPMPATKSRPDAVGGANDALIRTPETR